MGADSRPVAEAGVQGIRTQLARTRVDCLDTSQAQEQYVNFTGGKLGEVDADPLRADVPAGFRALGAAACALDLGRLTEGPGALSAGRALDVGCGTGRDAVYLAKHGWQVTAVDFADAAIAKAKQRTADEGVQVHWIAGDVSSLAGLALEPGYTLVYDFGCIQGLADSARQGAAAGITHLAVPGATLLVVAFAPGRRVLLPRGMDEQDVIGLFGDSWELEQAESASDATAPPPVRRARPSLYRLTRKRPAEEPPGS